MTDASRDRRLRPRKEPRQPRAVETRARILDAAAQVFEEHGYDAGTTNRIAAAAGMSVGSLYQYFPNKDAILVELLDAHIAAGAARVHDAMERLLAADASLHAIVEALVRELLVLHRDTPVLHQILMSRTPQPPDLTRRLAAVEDHLVDDLAAFLAARPDLALAAPERSARMVAMTVNGLVHAQVAHPDQPVADDAFVAETTTIVIAYLTSGAAAR